LTDGHKQDAVRAVQLKQVGTIFSLLLISSLSRQLSPVTFDFAGEALGRLFWGKQLLCTEQTLELQSFDLERRYKNVLAVKQVATQLPQRLT